MSQMILNIVCVLALVSLCSPPFATGLPLTQASEWSRPTCGLIVGSAAVTYTTDEGATLTPTDERLQGVGYTQGLAALDMPNILVAVFNTTLLRSTDAGCSWTTQGTLQLRAANPLLTIEAAPGGIAYAWSENGPDLVCIDAFGGLVYMKSPVESIVGLGVDRRDGAHLCVGGNDGSIWESTDVGGTWSAVGTSPVSGGTNLVYRISFDGRNLNHAVVGTAVHGAFVTFDGGSSWQSAKGLSDSGAVNVFNAAISPADGRRVWAMGLDLSRADSGSADRGRHIYVSTDGGLTFQSRIDNSPAVTLTNGPLMAAHPTNRDVLYFVFGSSFQGYGTDLFRYDESSRALTKTHNAYDKISSIAFSPGDPKVLYLGLAVEEMVIP